MADTINLARKTKGLIRNPSRRYSEKRSNRLGSENILNWGARKPRESCNARLLSLSIAKRRQHINRCNAMRLLPKLNERSKSRNLPTTRVASSLCCLAAAKDRPRQFLSLFHESTPPAEEPNVLSRKLRPATPHHSESSQLSPMDNT